MQDTFLDATTRTCCLSMLLPPTALTGDMLVLLEPGTPTGAAVIADARTQLLAYEARRTAKLRRAGILQGPSTIDGSQNNSIQHDANVARKLSSRQFGAHVVAPCPHDGVCPLAAPGSPAWCHFVVRFSRPKSLQDAKASHGAHTSAQNYQDERFSYVVLRCGSSSGSQHKIVARGF
jgi:ribosomal protein RSM22 (predicted rRNA methylase)